MSEWGREGDEREFGGQGGSWSLVVVSRLLIAVAPLVVEHGL